MAGHKYEAEKAGHLDGRLRRFMAPPELLLGRFAPLPGEIWAVIGAGTGFLAIPLAARVEKVHALDLSDKMLELLRRNLEDKQVDNVETARSEESALPLPDSSVDAVLLAFVLHEVDEPEKFLGEVSRITRPGGRLCVIEFTSSGSFGPPKDERLTSGKINDLAEGVGYETSRTWNWQRRLIGWKYFELAGYEFRKGS
ncbi:MAG: methyltransferase domain-containing protein [Actinobacteria bacterium]|nr:methyltransferase domain-containing protein [Actinomycetota bacterium]